MSYYSTTPDGGSKDDGYWAVTLPFSINFLGNTYQTVYVGTNSYITFGSASVLYYNLNSSTPALPKIHLGAADNSGQRLTWVTIGTSPNRAVTIKYEGTGATYGYLGASDLVWEATFYEATPFIIDIQFFKTPTSPYGFSGVYTSSGITTIYTGSLSTSSRSVQRIYTSSTSTYISNIPAPTKTLYMSGNAGAILIGTYGINLGSDGHSGAVTNPLAYTTNLYFHSSLDYSKIKGKAAASSVTFTGLTRNYTTWNDSDKSGCFITTACVKYNSQADNGIVLETLRAFRDNYMLNRSDVAELVEYYYSMAPECVEKIENGKNPAKAFNILYNEYILPAVDSILVGNNEQALSIYIDGIKEAINLAEQN